jgi:hypothetical protein
VAVNLDQAYSYGATGRGPCLVIRRRLIVVRLPEFREAIGILEPFARRTTHSRRCHPFAAWSAVTS